MIIDSCLVFSNAVVVTRSVWISTIDESTRSFEGCVWLVGKRTASCGSRKLSMSLDIIVLDVLKKSLEIKIVSNENKSDCS